MAANSDLAGAEIQLVPTVAREFRLQAALQTYLLAKQNAGQRFDYVFIKRHLFHDKLYIFSHYHKDKDHCVQFLDPP